MRGSIVQKPSGSGRWYVVVDMDRDPGTGARRRKWHSGYSSKRDAERGLTKILASLDKGSYLSPSRASVAKYLTQTSLPAIEPTVRPTTFNGYRAHINLYVIPRLGAEHLQRLTPDQLSTLPTSQFQYIHFKDLSPSAPPPPPPSGNGGPAIQNVKAARCLDVANGSGASGAAIQLYDCNGTRAQQWLAASRALRVYANSCLDVTGGALVSGTNVQLWPCNGTAAQQWTLATDGTIRTTNDLCLEAALGGTSNGTRARVYTCNSTLAQQWVGPSVANGGMTVKNANASRCLDVSGGRADLGTVIQLWDCNGTAAQQWLAASGALRAYANTCLDVPGGALVSGTNVQLWACNGTAAQQWTVQGDGTIRTTNGLCLEATFAGTANGTRARIYTCNGTPAQSWATA